MSRRFRSRHVAEHEQAVFRGAVFRRSAHRVRRGLAVLAIVGAGVVAACDSGPSGPGTLTATVVAPQPMGAVVLEFTGGGVTGFEGRGNTRAFGAAVVNQPEKHRVILVSPDGSPMQFGIRVTDLGAARPAAAAISATTVSNQPLLPQDLKIRIEN